MASDFRKRRLENLKVNNLELSHINAAKKLRVPKNTAPPKPRVRRVTNIAKAEVVPRRVTRRSMRLLEDGDSPHVKLEDIPSVLVEPERAMRTRVNGDVALGDVQVKGKNFKGLSALSDAGLGIPVRGANPGFKTFTEDDIKGTTDGSLKDLRLRMSALKLYEKFPVNDIRITPQRIYSMAFHPTEDKPLVFAGDKEGALGIFDASQEAPADHDDDDEDEKPSGPVISALPIHARTISGIHFHHKLPDSVFTASFDSSVRKVDLVKEISQQVCAPSGESDEMLMTAIDMPTDNANLLWFTTIDGSLGKQDLRVGPHKHDLWSLSDQKIGGFSLHPLHADLLATASLDRHMRLWDLRMLGKNGKVGRALVGENQARLSVSHAAFSRAGHVATSSYDDKIRIHVFPDAGSWTKGHELDDDDMEPAVEIKHNNQSGRWVTILKPQWQRRPRDGIQKFVIGNMGRFVDVYDANGMQLAQLDGDGITAVPAVAHFHPTMDWVAGGNASGKLCLWQ